MFRGRQPLPREDSEERSSSSSESSLEASSCGSATNGYALLPSQAPILDGGSPVQKLPQDLLLKYVCLCVCLR